MLYCNFAGCSKATKGGQSCAAAHNIAPRPATLTVAHAGAQQGDGPPHLCWGDAVVVWIVARALPMVAHGSHDRLQGARVESRGRTVAAITQLVQTTWMKRWGGEPADDQAADKHKAAAHECPNHTALLAVTISAAQPIYQHNAHTHLRREALGRGPQEGGHLGRIAGGGAAAKQVLQHADSWVGVVPVQRAVLHEGLTAGEGEGGWVACSWSAGFRCCTFLAAQTVDEAPPFAALVA